MSILITLDSDQFDDAYHQFDNAAYIWRATGEVASTAWFYDVVVYPVALPPPPGGAAPSC